MRFANPEAFLLVPLLPLVLWWTFRPRHHGAVRFSHLRLAARLPTGMAVLGPTLLALCRVLALGLLLVALAQPQATDATERVATDGLTIQLVLDNSLSMRTLDYDLGGRSLSRLDAVKHAVRLFVAGGEQGLTGRPDDRIGLITFARDPDVVCPITLDHEALLDALQRVSLAPPIGTNIGDALAWGLERVRREPGNDKIIILLSDGSHNVRDSMSPLEAAQLAADLKVKVYTIGAVGNRFGKAPSTRTASFTDAEDSVDEPMMQAIAARTGGQYYRATDTAGLLNIYESIDRLETTRIEGTVRVSYKEWFLAPVVAGLMLLALEHLLGATRLLRTP
jgi:Ca-activated chloride channel family protein